VGMSALGKADNPSLAKMSALVLGRAKTSRRLR
jgi:hypothetical protein